MVGAEAPQRLDEVVQECAAGGVDHPAAVPHDEASLGGDHHGLAGEARVEGLADHLLGDPGPVGGRGVDEVSPAVDEVVQEVVGGGPLHIAAPGHGAQTDAGDVEASGPERTQ